MNEVSQEFLSNLHRGLMAHFDVGELKTLCFHLGVDYDNVAGETKENKARELVLYLKRRGQLANLVKYGMAERPQFSWQPTSPTDAEAIVADDQLGLAFLSDFLRTALSDTNKTTLKPDSSSNRAKERIFALYETLGAVEDKTDEFVSALQTVAQTQASNATTSNESPERLFDAARQLMAALPELAYALDQVNPQLDIHQHGLVQQIEQYRQSRAMLLTELEQRASEARAQPPEMLAHFVQTAQTNQAIIKEAIAAMRAFLAAEFPFKESF